MENYKLLMDPFLYTIKQEKDEEIKPIFMGDKKNRKCIYCGKKKPEVTFKKDAHIIPAALGNRVIFNFDECDHCNEHYFGVQENELANYLMMDRIFIGAKKRNGLPKYKPLSKGETSIEHLPDSNTVSIKINDLEGRFIVTNDKKKKELTYKVFDPLPYRPVDICKSLTHMIWPFLSEEKREWLNHIPNWLLGKNEILPLYLDIAFIPGSGYSNVILECWESTETNANYPLMVRFTFGMKILSFYIPKSFQTTEPPIRNIDYIQIPEHLQINVDALVIKESNRIKPNDLTYTIRYNKVSTKIYFKNFLRKIFNKLKFR